MAKRYAKTAGGLGLVGLVLVVALGVAGCIENERSFIIAFVAPPDDDCASPSTSSGTDFVYRPFGLIDLNFGSFNGQPTYSFFIEAHNYIQVNQNSTQDRLNSARITIEWIQVRYRWLVGRELLEQPGLEGLGILEDLEVNIPYAVVLEGTDSFDDPSRIIVFISEAIPPDVGTTLTALGATDAHKATLGVEIKLVGHLGDGSRIESDEFLFPVKFCWDCHICPAGLEYGACFPGQDSPKCAAAGG
jgi:hypothetical protein